MSWQDECRRSPRSFAERKATLIDFPIQRRLRSGSAETLLLAALDLSVNSIPYSSCAIRTSPKQLFLIRSVGPDSPTPQIGALNLIDPSRHFSTPEEPAFNEIPDWEVSPHDFLIEPFNRSSHQTRSGF